MQTESPSLPRAWFEQNGRNYRTAKHEAWALHKLRRHCEYRPAQSTADLKNTPAAPSTGVWSWR
jgi:hypothetical protein